MLNFFLQLGSFSHGFTYSGHPVACAVALEAIKIYKYVGLNCLSTSFYDHVLFILYPHCNFHMVTLVLWLLITLHFSLWAWYLLYLASAEDTNYFRERNMVERVNRISPKFQEGLKAFSDSPIIGEVQLLSLV